MAAAHEELFLDFDIVSPELMDCMESLRRSRIMTPAFEDLSDATPLLASERGKNSICFIANTAFAFVPSSTDMPSSRQEQ